MSRQSSDMPDAPEVTPSSKSRKEKPWKLWEKWPPNRFGVGGWSCFGRYRTKEEAEKVMALEWRRWHGRGGFIEMPKNPGSYSRHLTRPFAYLPEELKVLHESEGKPV